jgi:hypothetical protein
VKKALRKPARWETQVHLLIFLVAIFSDRSALAHRCDTNEVHLTAGAACLWKITADRLEHHELRSTLSGTAGVAGISPNVPFKAHHGDCMLRGWRPEPTNYRWPVGTRRRWRQECAT